MTTTLEDRLAQMVWTVGAVQLATDPRVVTTVFPEPDLEDLNAAAMSKQRADEIV